MCSLILAGLAAIAISNAAAAACDADGLARLIQQSNPTASPETQVGVFRNLWSMFCSQGGYVPPAPLPPTITDCSWDHNGHWVCIQP